jgi:hypothetical protein
MISYLLSEKSGQQFPEGASWKIWHKIPPETAQKNRLKAPLPEIMQQPWPPHPQKGFWDVLLGKNLPEFLFLKPNPPVEAMIAQVSLKK